MARVKDIMTKGVITVQEDFSIFDIAESMAKYNISGVAVLGGEKGIEGVISETDILKAVAEEKNLQRIKARDIMTPCVITVDPEWGLEEVSRLMQRENIRRLFVCIDEKIEPARIGPKYRQKPVGIITASDVVRELSKRL